MGILDYLSERSEINQPLLSSLASMIGQAVPPRPSAEQPDYDMERYNFEHPTHKYLSSHYPDTYKLPSHPTFSDDSIYSNKLFTGGRWQKDGSHDVFRPSVFGYNQRSEAALDAYLRENDPTVSLYRLPTHTAGDLINKRDWRTQFPPLEVDRSNKAYRASEFYSAEPNLDEGPIWSSGRVSMLEDLLKSENFRPFTVENNKNWSSDIGELAQLLKYLTAREDNYILLDGMTKQPHVVRPGKYDKFEY